MKFKNKYQKIIELARPYYKKGREMDEEHHLVVAQMIEELLKEVLLDKETMMSAALLHDIGYAKISPNRRQTHWKDKVVRDHMEYGAEIAKKILERVAFPKEKIKKICQIISIHDNPAIGLKITSKEGKILKEADILWMTTKQAFWLDVKRRPELTPNKWLQILENRFTQEKAYTRYLKTKFSQKRTKEFIEKMKKNILFR